MNQHAATARKQMDVMTLVVSMVLALGLLAVATYITVHDVVPFIHAFLGQLVPPQKINSK